MTNPMLDADRVAFLAARQRIGTRVLPAWPRLEKDLDYVQVEVEWVRFSTLNHRTRAEQLKEIHVSGQPDLFSSDPLGRRAQDSQFTILKSQQGFEDLKSDLKKRGQKEPAVITADGVLINGNRRTAALRSLYKDDDNRDAKYVLCLVLPHDAQAGELVDIEAELQVARDFKEEYSWINEAMLIEELYDRESKDFGRVAARMHRTVPDVRGLYERLQQLHQLVAMSNGARQHIDFKENSSAFEELNKYISDKQRSESDSVRAAYFIGTLTGVNYRKLRHLRRPDASRLIQDELEKNPALSRFLELVARGDEVQQPRDELDDFLGEHEPKAPLLPVLGFLAARRPDDVVLLDGERRMVSELCETINLAVTSAANEADEEQQDKSAVTAPIVRVQNALSEMQRAAIALPKARRYEEWNEAHFQELLEQLSKIVKRIGADG